MLSEQLSGTEYVCASVHCCALLQNSPECSRTLHFFQLSPLQLITHCQKTQLQHTLQVWFVCFPYWDVNPGAPTHSKGLKYLNTLLQSEATLQYVKSRNLRIEQKRQV